MTGEDVSAFWNIHEACLMLISCSVYSVPLAYFSVESDTAHYRDANGVAKLSCGLYDRLQVNIFVP